MTEPISRAVGAPSRVLRLAGDRRGFSLAELAVVVMVVGILSGLALPNLRGALLRAEATSAVADARTVSGAAYSYLADNGVFPGGGAYGTIPSGMESYLPADFDFTYRGMNYMWLGITLPNASNTWGTRNLGLFVIDYSQRPEMAQSFQAFQGGNAFWSSTLMYFLYLG